MKSIGNYGTGGSNIILRNRQVNFVNLVATITDTRVHEDTLILVYYSEATQAAAQAAGITTETNEGNITFTAANPPSSTIVCDVVLLSANMVSQMASASDIDYNNIASGLTATDVQGAVDELAESYPADNVMMSDGVTSVEDAVDEVTEALTVGNVTSVNVATLDIWFVTDVPIESTGLYSVMYTSNAGMRYQLIVLGANLYTIQTPIGMTGNINEVNNILLAKEGGTNKLCMYVSSGVGAGTYYVAKLMDLLGTV